MAGGAVRCEQTHTVARSHSEQPASTSRPHKASGLDGYGFLHGLVDEVVELQLPQTSLQRALCRSLHTSGSHGPSMHSYELERAHVSSYRAHDLIPVEE